MNKIAIASDHAGFKLKSQLIEYYKNKGITIEDLGTYTEASCDYPDFGHKLGKMIQENLITAGIAICGSGNGINMTVNKYPKVRAALCWNKEISVLARLHNDANICSLPARFLDVDKAIEITEIFFNTQFEGGRHQIRVEKIGLK